MFEIMERSEMTPGLINTIYMVVGQSTAPFQTLQVGGLLPRCHLAPGTAW